VHCAVHYCAAQSDQMKSKETHLWIERLEGKRSRVTRIHASDTRRSI
jgi:hypothetical protein